MKCSLIKVGHFMHVASLLLFLFTDGLKLKFDEIISECFASVHADKNNFAIQDEKDITLGNYFVYETFDSVHQSHAGFLISYVFYVFRGCQAFLCKNVSVLLY